MRALVLSGAAALFFAFTFIFNRSMALEGGSWMWSAALRFLFMLPIMLGVLWVRGELGTALAHFRGHRAAYVLWGTVGFGFFYAPLTFAADHGPGWLVAGAWQLTIVCGSLLVPWLWPGCGVPWRNLRWSALVILGVGLMEWRQSEAVGAGTVLLTLPPIILAAFMYPLGNRKMMLVCQSEVGTLARVFNMTLGSWPFWLFLAACAALDNGVPSAGQLGQSLLVAVFAGVIATVLFFSATNLVRDDPPKLAAIEATQAGEVLFALLGEVAFLGTGLPDAWGLAGLLLVVGGVALGNLAAHRKRG